MTLILILIIIIPEVKKWANVKIVNQVGSRVKIKPNKILPSSVLRSGEIFVYHRLLTDTDRKATITLKAVDEYTDKPLTLNGKRKLTVKPTTSDDTQEVYVAREGECILSLNIRGFESPVQLFFSKYLPLKKARERFQ